jgi:hypothetical protein
MLTSGDPIHVLICEKCERVTTTGGGWRGYLTDDDPPEVAFYCPRCAQREFGFSREFNDADGGDGYG